MNYFFYRIAAAEFVALGSAFPIVQSTFAQDGDTNIVDTCTGEVGNNADCRTQGCQIGSGNTQNNFTFKDGDTSTTNTTDTCTRTFGPSDPNCRQEECQIGSGKTQNGFNFE